MDRDGSVSQHNDAWMAGYAAGMAAGQAEYAAVIAERDQHATRAELLRLERDQYADRAHTAEQELSSVGWADPDRGALEAEAS
jgi:hypothetical protein